MSYSVREVAAMLGLTAAQIRSYVRKGLLSPEHGPGGDIRFGLRALVVLRTAAELTSAQIPQRKVQRVLERLHEQLPPGRSLAGVRITADGERVVVRAGAMGWNPESGQELFDFSVPDIVEKTATLGLAKKPEDHLDPEDWYELACALALPSAIRSKVTYPRPPPLNP